MTPERMKYLINISTRESKVRHLLFTHKYQISKYKSLLNNNELSDYERRLFRERIDQEKFFASLCRNEIKRLTGMDRVAVPKQTKHEVLPKTTNRPAIMSKPYFVCECGDTVGFMMGNEWQKATYCTHCGRLILWEKVKKAPSEFRKVCNQ